jgi:hypothetical protein
VLKQPQCIYVYTYIYVHIQSLYGVCVLLYAKIRNLQTKNSWNCE